MASNERGCDVPKGGRRPGAGPPLGSHNNPSGKGKPAGPGRPKGSKNLKSSYRILKELYGSGELMPLDFMISEMRRLAQEATDDSLREARMLAQAAAPYCHPRLQAIVAKTVEGGDTLTALLKAIDGTTTGIAIGEFEEPSMGLNNLYHCQTKEGRIVPFRLNWAQTELFNGLHECNLILKARQLGFTTFIQIFMLDACLFNSNIRAGTIAHRLDDARVIFRDKVQFVYDLLPEVLKAAVPILRSTADELVFGNNSSIRVSTSMRSGTLQYLHVSEYGQLCAKFLDKAREVRTGALNTVQAGRMGRKGTSMSSVNRRRQSKGLMSH
jgi:hypothetical protein